MALRDVDFSLAPGEVRALLGKNGAGKSTLIKILGGAERPDNGTVEIDGKLAHLRSPADGIAAGIATVHQELSIIPELPGWRKHLPRALAPARTTGIDWRRVIKESREALAQLGLTIDPRQPASGIAIAERQLVEIARALRQGARVVILDEPTTLMPCRGDPRRADQGQQ